MARRGFFQTLDRLGLLKYVLAALFTFSALGLTAGAFVIDTLQHRPAKPKAAPAAWLKPDRQATPPSWAMRAPVAHTARRLCRPLVSRAVRFWVARGSMAYSAVTHPPGLPEL